MDNTLSSVKYDDKLIESFINSDAYKRSLNDPELNKRIGLLRIISEHVLRKNTISGLKKKLMLAKLSEKSCDAWLDACCSGMTQEMISLHDELDRKYKTGLRGLYIEIISELMYDKHKKTLDPLPLEL